MTVYEWIKDKNTTAYDIADLLCDLFNYADVKCEDCPMYKKCGRHGADDGTHYGMEVFLKRDEHLAFREGHDKGYDD